MPAGFPVACPGCGAQYLLPQQPPFGQFLNCPACGQSFDPQAPSPAPSGYEMHGGAPAQQGLPRWLLPAGIGAAVLVVAAIVGVSIGKMIGRPKAIAGGGGADGGAAANGGLLVSTTSSPTRPTT